MEEESVFCRLCLSSSVVYYSLLKNNGKEMVLSLTGIEINEDDPSTESCAKCWLDLKLAYFIQQCFVQAENKLKEAHFVSSEENKIKVEAESTQESVKVEVDDSAGANNKVENSEETYGNESDDGELIYIQTEEDITEEKPSICTICGLQCKSETEFYAHINIHFNSPQPCDDCVKSLPNISAYRHHVQMQHPDLHEKIHVCGICSVSFKYRPLYDLHLASLHRDTARSRKKRTFLHLIADKDGSIKCEKCNKYYLDKKSYAIHLKYHEKKLCPICGARITRSFLKKHISSHQINPVKCDLCGKTCKHSESLKWHIYHSHTIRRKRKCEECGAEFKKLYDYKIHLKQHAGEKNCTCHMCGKGFYTNYKLQAHIKLSHLKEYRYICKYCPNGYNRIENLRIHERKHTKELPFICEICGEGFRQNGSLLTHKKSKHKITEVKTAQCPICNKMFKNDLSLRNHRIRVHNTKSKI